MKQKGFTLIELLVVIAIIGILASVVLASLNTARAKGADAAIKAGLANTRAQAELFYDSNGNSYLTACAVASDALAVKGINGMVLAAARAYGGISTVSVNAAGSLTTATCNDTALGWAAQVPLKTDLTRVYCVDNKGTATSTTVMLSAGTSITCAS
ncbi:MAG: type II secretion system protein [Patescibacteria group bacterium]